MATLGRTECGGEGGQPEAAVAHSSRQAMMGRAGGLGRGEKWLHLEVELAGLAAGQHGG